MPGTALTIARYLKKRTYNIIFCGVLLLFVYVQYSTLNNPSRTWLFYLAFALIFVLEIVTTIIMVRRKPEGQLLVRRRKRAYVLGISICLFCISAWQYWMVQNLGPKTQRPLFLAMLACFAWTAICQLIVFCLFRVYRPVSLVINGYRLLVYDRMVDEFNLENLTTIKLDDMENRLELMFTGNKWLKVIIKEFSRQDLLSFIPAAIALSKHAVEVKPAVYRKLDPAPPPPPLPFFRRIGKGLKDTFLP